MSFKTYAVFLHPELFQAVYLPVVLHSLEKLLTPNFCFSAPFDLYSNSNLLNIKELSDTPKQCLTGIEAALVFPQPPGGERESHASPDGVRQLGAWFLVISNFLGFSRLPRGGASIAIQEDV